MNVRPLALVFVLAAIAFSARGGVPAGAAALGYTRCVIDEKPVSADIAPGDNGNYKWFSGQWYAKAPPRRHYSTKEGALVLSLGGDLVSMPRDFTEGKLPVLSGAAGFYVEFDVQLSGNSPDHFPAVWLMPVEHPHGDHYAGDPPDYERFMEFDIDEGGFGPGMAGTVHSWAGIYPKFAGHVQNPNNLSPNALDRSLKHTFGGSYDPVNQTVTWWLDGVKQMSAGPPYVPAVAAKQRFYMILSAQTHGKNEPYSMIVSGVRAYAPPAVADNLKPVAGGQVEVSETTLLGDMECFRIKTPAATYLYGKRGAGFAAILDPDGRDWISYRHGGKSTGEDRGLPKCGQPVNYFHCGYGHGKDANDNWFTSEITLRMAGHVRIRSVTKRGDAEGEWDFFPAHATFTLRKIPGGRYWFLYDGTPGGKLDAADDFVIRPGGRKSALSEPWNGRVPWVVFGAKESPHRFFLLNHQSGGPGDSYVAWPLKATAAEPLNQMTAFGFGRADWKGADQQMPAATELPARFTIGFTRTAEAGALEKEMEALRKPEIGKER